MNKRVKIKIYSSGKPKDSNLYLINYGPDITCAMRPSLNCLKIDLNESGLSKILRFPETLDYIAIKDIENYRFEGFECVSASGNEYYFCFDHIVVLIAVDKFSEAFRYFDGKTIAALELCLGAVIDQGELQIDEREFKKFIYETVDWDARDL
mgnify:FL=1